MSDLVRFQFHGDDLQVIPEDGEVWVVIKRFCDALGIDARSQRAKLQSDPSICGAIITSQIKGDDQARRRAAAVEAAQRDLFN
jgi:prophage antirepressor-like protein